VLQRFGYDADELSADRSQKDREEILDQVRRKNLRFLVATDVASRGIDIPQLSHVIQYEPPEDAEDYVHRSGRTGRAGATGIALSLASEAETLDIDQITKRYGIEFRQRPVPNDEDVAAVVSERATTFLEARFRERDKLKIERSKRFLPLSNSLAENEDGALLIAMLIDDYYQQTLHGLPKETAKKAPPTSRKNLKGTTGKSSRSHRSSRRSPRPRRP